MDDQTLQNLAELLRDPLIIKLIWMAVLFIVILIASSLVQKLAARRIEDPYLRYRARKLIGFGSLVLIIILTIAVFSEGLRGLGLALGVAGAGIAFALQEVIASIAGWIQISTTHMFRTGDRIQLGGIMGDVIDIGILHTTIMECGQWVEGDLYNGRIVRVANSKAFKEPVFNYSNYYPLLWDELTVPIKYGSDIKLARNLMEEAADAVIGEYEVHAQKAWNRVARQFLVEDARIKHRVTMRLNESFIAFRIRYVTDYKLRRQTSDRIYTEVYERIENTRGRVLVSTAVALEIDQASTLEVTVRDTQAQREEHR